MPVYTETLFWILTLLPITTSLATSTFCPQDAALADLGPRITWQKCQIFVPAPISHGSST